MIYDDLSYKVKCKEANGYNVKGANKGVMPGSK
jgi:hypothetical protein